MRHSVRWLMSSVFSKATFVQFNESSQQKDKKKKKQNKTQTSVCRHRKLPSLVQQVSVSGSPAAAGPLQSAAAAQPLICIYLHLRLSSVKNDSQETPLTL